MKQKWVLILGANSDMAKAAARSFARDGYNIYLASRDTQELDKEAAHLGLKYGIQASSLHFDALDTGSHPGFFAGLNPCPAGVVLAFGLLGDQQQAQSDFFLAQRIIDTNYTGAVSILEVVAAAFERKKSGFIVGISSVAGDRGRQSNYIYGSAKAGLSAYLSGLRHRLFRSGVSVTTVKPGFAATKMTAGLDLPERLTAQPSEVGDRIVTAVKKKKDTVYIKPVWRLIMCIIIHLPEFVFKRTKL
ncbi:MAG: SDR family oxidoreductase [Desulfonatronovibrionaceae bacterium]